VCVYVDHKGLSNLQKEFAVPVHLTKYYCVHRFVTLITFVTFSFQGIVSDLFPGVILPEPDYTIFNTAVMNACKTANIQCIPPFLEKIQQIYEMMSLRHGLMIVGFPFGGKTTAYRMLAGALAEMEEKVFKVQS
jgi:hypothetical protein